MTNKNTENNNDRPDPLTGQIIRGRNQRPHNLDGDMSGFRLRWQGGCLGCLIPFILGFLLIFFLFRLT